MEFAIPANPGPDPGFRRSDASKDFLRNHRLWKVRSRSGRKDGVPKMQRRKNQGV